MREHHAHIAAHGQSLSMPSLADCSSLPECLERVRDVAGEVPAGGWVRFLSARVEAWPERRWPTLTELDRAAPHRSCVLMSFDHHAAAANTTAMRAGGVRPGERVPPQGVVCVDGQGEPTGLLLEHAAYKVWEAAPEPTKQERREHVRQALVELARMGFTEVHDLHSQEWLPSVLADLAVNDEMPVERVLLYPNVARLPDMHRMRARWESERVVLAGGKLFADGTLNSRTALMLHPYREPLDGLTHGQMMATPEDVGLALDLTGSLGVQLAVHAIGDGAVRMVLDVYEKASRDQGIEASRRGRSRSGSMPGRLDASMPSLRIEHCELIDERDVPRFAQLGVACSVQPCHLLADIEVLTRQLPHRLDRVLPLRELMDSGCRPPGVDGDGGLLWFGSDVPIVRADPGDSIRAAVHRCRDGMSHADAIGACQAIGEAEAWAGFGRHS